MVETRYSIKPHGADDAAGREFRFVKKLGSPPLGMRSGRKPYTVWVCGRRTRIGRVDAVGLSRSRTLRVIHTPRSILTFCFFGWTASGSSALFRRGRWGIRRHRRDEAKDRGSVRRQGTRRDRQAEDVEPKEGGKTRMAAMIGLGSAEAKGGGW